MIAYLTKEGSFKDRLSALVDKAGVTNRVKDAASADDLRKRVGKSPVVVEALYNATLG